MIESWTEDLFDLHMGCTKTHMSMTQDGPNKKLRWKHYSLLETAPCEGAITRRLPEASPNVNQNYLATLLFVVQGRQYERRELIKKLLADGGFPMMKGTFAPAIGDRRSRGGGYSRVCCRTDQGGKVMLDGQARRSRRRPREKRDSR